MKKIKIPLLEKMKPVKGGSAIIIKSDRHNSSQTFSLLFYKPVSKFEIKEPK